MLKFMQNTLDECRISMKWVIQVTAELACTAIDKVIGTIIGR